MQSVNGLKAWASVKKTNDIGITVSIKETEIKKTFGKSLTIPLNFDLFKHPVCPYKPKEDLIVRLELNYFEKVIFCSGDTAATYKLTEISLDYYAIVDKRYIWWNSSDSTYQGNTDPFPGTI